jgi:hypothetical protein
VDASYLVHPDSKSHTGYALSFGEIGTFYAKSIKQPLVATSSSHAEMRALYTAIQDIIFVINLCKNMKINLKIPAIIFEDNQPVIQLAMTTSTGIKKCRHFQMLIAFIKEKVDEGLVTIKKIDTSKNPADILSKVEISGSNYLEKVKSLLLGNVH